MLTENSLFIPRSLHQPIPRKECDNVPIMYDEARNFCPNDKEIP
jgi:hypothetical protein